MLFGYFGKFMECNGKDGYIGCNMPLIAPNEGKKEKKKEGGREIAMRVRKALRKVVP